jgi:hypothetical protein
MFPLRIRIEAAARTHPGDFGRDSHPWASAVHKKFRSKIIIQIQSELICGSCIFRDRKVDPEALGGGVAMLAV